MSKTLEQIYILNPKTSFLDTDIFYGVELPYTPGTDFGFNWATLKSQILALAGSAEQTIYVSPDGNDTTGLGTVEQPFATYEKARSIAVLTAAQGHQFVIIPVGQFNITGDMILSPFVNISGYSNYSTQFDITGSVLLDPLFDTTASPTCQVMGIDIAAATGINLSFGTFQDAQVQFENVDFANTPTFAATGAGLNVNPELVIIINCLSKGSVPSFTFTNIIGAIVSSIASNGVTSINNSSVTSTTCILDTLYGPNASFTFQTTGTANQNVLIQNVFFYGGNFVIDGNLNQILIDSSSYMTTPVFAGGATESNITILSLSDGIESNTNFTPVNYTPTAGPNFKANSVTGNLAGIDNAFGSIGVVSPGSINEMAWYAATGSTVSGLPTIASAVLQSSVGGVPSWSTTLPSAVQLNITQLGTITTGTWHGTAIDATHGGTAQTTWTLGDILYSSAANTLSRLAGNITTTKQFLSQTGTGVVSASPAWSTISGSDITGPVSSSSSSVITDDTTTNATMFPTWVTANTGSLPIKVSSTKLSFNPSTATMTLTGAINGLTGKISAPIAIASSSGLNILGFSYISSAVNNIIISNNVTGSGPIIFASGTDPSVAMTLASKGGIIEIIDAGATNAGILSFKNAANTFGVSLTANTTQASNVTFTLPSADGAAGTFLKTSGAGVLSFTTAIKSVTSQVFTATGANTYTPTSGAIFCYVRCIAGGGAGGGSAGTASQVSVGGGGGAGAYSEGIYPVSTMIGAGTTAQITVGAGGTAGTAGNNPGNTGGSSSVIANGGAGTTLILCVGGTGGAGSASTVTSVVSAGGAGGALTTSGNMFGTAGATGSGGIAALNATAAVSIPGSGAGSHFGSGAAGPLSNTTNSAGNAAVNYGAGGSGANGFNTTANVAGGAGKQGIVIIMEYLSV